MTRHTPGHRVNAEADVHALLAQEFGDFIDSVLCLCYRHAVAGNNHHRLGVARVEPRRFLLADSGDELVHFQLTTTTPAETLGTALYRTPIAGLRVQVTPVGPSTLRLECVPAQDLPSAEPPVTDAGTP